MFRSLFEAIESNWHGRESSLYQAVLVPWIEQNSKKVDWLNEFARRIGSPIPIAGKDELYDLYSLSRVIEVLVESFHHKIWEIAPQKAGFAISMNDFSQFVTALGLTIIPDGDFSPILHEIVEVLQSDNDTDEISLVGTYWPPLMLGNMVLYRGGASVTGGRNNIVKKIAENSPLFWAWRRPNRQAMDLSHGWGSNSQWRTALRRDYVIGGTAFLNVDGNGAITDYPDADDSLIELGEAMRFEFLSNRCFIKTHFNGDILNLWPYEDKLTVLNFAIYGLN